MTAFEKIVKERRSIRRFEEGADYNPDTIKNCLELAILSPNSSNLQTWEFIRINKKEHLKQMVPYCMGQDAARSASELVLFVTRVDKWKERATWNLEKVKENVKDLENPTKQEKRGLDYYKKLIPLFYGNFPWPFKTILRYLIVWGRTLAGKPMMRLATANDQLIVGHKSTALAAQTFMLAMQSEGMATCPMEGFDSKLVKKLVGLPSKAEITMIVACGIAAGDGITNPRWRLGYDEVVTEL